MRAVSIAIYAVMLFIAGFPASLAQNSRGTVRPHPVVVRIDKVSKGVQCRVDSKVITETPAGDLLYALNQIRAHRGEDVPVVVLLDPRVPIEKIWDVDGTASKAQLNNLHFFVFDLDTKLMTEIKLVRSVPYSANPPLR